MQVLYDTVCDSHYGDMDLGYPAVLYQSAGPGVGCTKPEELRSTRAISRCNSPWGLLVQSGVMRLTCLRFSNASFLYVPPVPHSRLHYVPTHHDLGKITLLPLREGWVGCCSIPGAGSLADPRGRRLISTKSHDPIIPPALIFDIRSVCILSTASSSVSCQEPGTRPSALPTRDEANEREPDPPMEA